MNKKLKSIVMALAICVLGYTQIGCQSDNIKNENKQEVKDYSTQANSENQNNTNSNINNSSTFKKRFEVLTFTTQYSIQNIILGCFYRFQYS